MDKAEIRRERLTVRRAVAPQDRDSADAALRAHVAQLVGSRAPATVCGYAPMPGEPGGPELVDAVVAALPAPGRLLLPLVRADLDLDWAEYATAGDLGPPSPRVREPLTAALGPAAITSAELVLVPAVAVDHSGVRLGRGGGSFDRALARVNPAALIVALLYDGEIVNALPAAPHDIPVHAVITPSGGLRHFAAPEADWTNSGS